MGDGTPAAMSDGDGGGLSGWAPAPRLMNRSNNNPSIESRARVAAAVRSHARRSSCVPGMPGAGRGCSWQASDSLYPSLAVWLRTCPLRHPPSPAEQHPPSHCLARMSSCRRGSPAPTLHIRSTVLLPVIFVSAPFYPSLISCLSSSPHRVPIPSVAPPWPRHTLPLISSGPLPFRSKLTSGRAPRMGLLHL